MIDGYEFWYMGFVNYDKGIKNMQEVVWLVYSYGNFFGGLMLVGVVLYFFLMSGIFLLVYFFLLGYFNVLQLLLLGYFLVVKFGYFLVQFFS